MAGTVTGKITRELMAHYLDTQFAPTGNSPSWYRLGEDLEEFSVELNADTESKKNILGRNKFLNNGYEPSSDADDYYAEVGDPLFTKLQDIVDNRYTGDQTKTMSLEVHLWDGDATTGFVAWRQPCYVTPTSYGGDTSGYQIPFSINYVGERVKGKFIPNSETGGGTFTADA